MEFQYEIKNKILKKMVEKKAKKLNISVNQLIWGYVNRGLMSDALNDDVFNKLHSKKFLKEINESLGVD
ncbi:hypothetical protein [Methanobrevibacter sp.]|uniref:hypothetical protein n=1 Tax=Methanobrevibacter sp. TaxID=66852 RepID=UPI00388DEBC8